MPKSRTPPDPTAPPSLTERHESARAKVGDRIAKGEAIRGRTVQVDGDAYLYNKDLTKWDEYNETLLRSLFTGNEIFDNYRWGTAAPSAPDHESYMAEYRRRVSSLNDKIEFLESLVERIDAMPLASGVAASSPTERNDLGPLVFLSHATLDAELAAYVEETLRASIKPVRVFRTSRPGQMTAGQGWFEEIRQNLLRAHAYVVLVTPRSHDRWWVLFEAGAALRSEKTFVPMLAGGLTPSGVNEPLKYLTLRDIEQEPDAEQAFEELGGRLHDASDFVAHVKRLAEEGRVAAAVEGGFEYVVHEGRVYAWAGPLHDLANGVAPVREPDGLVDALKDKGLDTTHGLLQDPREGGRGFFPVFELDKEWRCKSRVMRSSDDQVLWVKPAGAGSHGAIEIPWRGVEVRGRYFAWDGLPLHSLKDWPPVPAPEFAIDAIRQLGHTPSFGRREKLREHLAKGMLQVFETDRRSWRKELLYDADGSQVLLVREAST